jgi:hypothetical protein
MKLRRLALMAAILTAGMTAASCGSDGGEAGGTAPRPALDPIPERVVSQADGNCRWMLREVTRVAEEARHTPYRSGLELTTEGIAKPGLELMRRLARKQGALRAAASDARFDAYVELFDPIIVLGEQRLEVGLAGDERRSEQLQELLTDLGTEQREAAARAGLRACEPDFFDVVVRKAFG